MRQALRGIYEEMTATEPISYAEEADAEIESRESYGRELAIANRLAQKFGHDWSGRFEEAELLANPPSLAKIRQLCMEQDRPGWMVGITAPHVDEAGNFYHVTATGRASWEVWAGGDGVSLVVSRPEPIGEVLRLEVDLDENFRVTDVLWRTLKPCGTRHVAALKKMLSAFDYSEQYQLRFRLEDLEQSADQWDAIEGSILILQEAQDKVWKGTILKIDHIQNREAVPDPEFGAAMAEMDQYI